MAFVVDEGRLIGGEARVQQLEGEVASLREENAKLAADVGAHVLNDAKKDALLSQLSTEKETLEKRSADDAAVRQQLEARLAEADAARAQVEAALRSSEEARVQLQHSLSSKSAELDQASAKISELGELVAARDEELLKMKDKHRAALSRVVRKAKELGESSTRRCVFWAYPDLNWGKVDEQIKLGKGQEPHPKDDEWITDDFDDEDDY